MTTNNPTEGRAGKVLSAENAALLKSAHAALEAVFDAADIDPDEDDFPTPEGGEEGDEVSPTMNPATAQDGSGSRSAFIPAPPVIRVATPPVIIRGGPAAGAETR